MCFLFGFSGHEVGCGGGKDCVKFQRSFEILFWGGGKGGGNFYGVRFRLKGNSLKKKKGNCSGVDCLVGEFSLERVSVRWGWFVNCKFYVISWWFCIWTMMGEKFNMG